MLITKQDFTFKINILHSPKQDETDLELLNLITQQTCTKMHIKSREKI